MLSLHLGIHPCVKMQKHDLIKTLTHCAKHARACHESVSQLASQVSFGALITGKN